MADRIEQEPPLVIDELVSPENRLLLEGLNSQLVATPGLIKEFVEVYDEHPEAVGRVVKLLEEQPETLSILSGVVKVFESDADTEAGYRPDIEDAILADPEFQRLRQEAMNSTDLDKGARLRRRIRHLWIGKTAEIMDAA